MSFQEQRAWIYAAVAVLVPVVYLAVIGVRLGGEGGADDVAYTTPLLIAVGGAVVLNIAANVVAGIRAPKEAGVTDERDRRIDRFGDQIGFYVMSVAALGALILAVTEAAHFWIANSLYLSYVLAAVVSSVVKIVAYRRGL